MVRRHFIASIKKQDGLGVASKLIEKRSALVERVLMARIELQDVLKAQQRLIKTFHLNENVAHVSP